MIGTLVKQLAESCADLDERMQQGEGQVAEVNAKLIAATSSVKELEEHLRANARSLSAKYERQAEAVCPTSSPARCPELFRVPHIGMMSPRSRVTARRRNPQRQKGPRPVHSQRRGNNR